RREQRLVPCDVEELRDAAHRTLGLRDEVLVTEDEVPVAGVPLRCRERAPQAEPDADEIRRLAGLHVEPRDRGRDAPRIPEKVDEPRPGVARADLGDAVLLARGLLDP